MKVPVEILVLLCVGVGVFPGYTVRPLLEAAAVAVLQMPLPDFSLSIWHGFTTPFIMSLVALGGGVALYSARKWVFAAHERFPVTLSGKALAEGFVESCSASGVGSIVPWTTAACADTVFCCCRAP